MKYVYLLLLILVLYYLFLNIYQKYSNQEDFDPSLVPVSSIVTLAKVAQKLVDGGGTLTNPGNLQIGLPSAGAVGNLYVTGTNKVDGNTTIGGTLGVTGFTTLNGGISTTTIGATDNIAANSFSTTNGNVSINNGSINLTSDGTGGLYFLRSGTPGVPVYNRLYMGNTNVTGDFSASGNATVSKDLDVKGNTTLGNLKVKKGTVSPDNSKIEFGDGSGWRVRYQQSDTKPIMDIYDNQNVKVTGGLSICDPTDPEKCATLTYDSAKGMLTFDKGLKINNPVNKPGVVTDTVVITGPNRTATGNVRDNIGIEALAANVLNYPWIPNGSMSFVGRRNDDYDYQVWRGEKRAHSQAKGRIGAIYGKEIQDGGIGWDKWYELTRNEYGGYLPLP